MKAKLIKTNDEYRLYVDDVLPYATSDNSPYKRLSKQNCDEIFGVVDVKEVIAKNMLDHNIVDKAVDFSNANPENNGAYLAYIAGASEAFKAMELNKDKVFSKGDMAYIINIMSIHELSFEDAIIKFQSLQQPTEIEVEIVTEEKSYSYLVTIGEVKTTRLEPKLDSSGQLILKKI
jgi:hypothetical protein